MQKLQKKMTAPCRRRALFVVRRHGSRAFAQRQIAARTTAGQPEVKVKLAGSLKRNEQSVALDKVSAVHPGEILDWTHHERE